MEKVHNSILTFTEDIILIIDMILPTTIFEDKMTFSLFFHYFNPLVLFITFFPLKLREFMHGKPTRVRRTQTWASAGSIQI